MKLHGFLATAAAAFVCCVTLGCPPAENEEVPVDVDVVAPAEDSNTTTAPAPATPPAEGVEADVVETEPTE
ncbi:hypothetical protein [Candidatus Laterigemmans baculatus]|uniref:hypothetical protein n=1 Tax=Candidatus Laterigemmans baculatus TaxID=2770505 RepID=UPI0013D9BBA4|nr:hypothetical protein [Candidatus Laterigemmans baculatus]